MAIALVTTLGCGVGYCLALFLECMLADCPLSGRERWSLRCLMTGLFGGIGGGAVFLIWCVWEALKGAP